MIMRKCDMCGKFIESNENYRIVNIEPSGGLIARTFGTITTPGIIEDGDLCIDCAEKIKGIIERYKNSQRENN